MPASVKVVREKPYVYGKHWAPHDIEVTEIASGLTRRQAAAGMGMIGVGAGGVATVKLIGGTSGKTGKTGAGAGAFSANLREAASTSATRRNQPFRNLFCLGSFATMDFRNLVRAAQYEVIASSAG